MNNIIWLIVIALLLTISVYFMHKLGPIQLNIISMVNSLKSDKTSLISPLKGFFIGLAARIGVGNIISIGYAIFYSGPGSIFWIWIISILSSIIVYIETYLGTIYKEKHNNLYYAGPNYYIKKGLKNNKLSLIYSILIIIGYSIFFNSIQANTIAINTSINPYIIGILLSIITFVIVNKGIDKLIDITNKLVPVMLIIFIFLSLYVLIKNIHVVPRILKIIINDAFNFKSIKDAIIIILISSKRAIFANEVGIGTSSITSCITDNNDYNKIGYMQMISVFITSIVITTLLSIIILSSNYKILDLSNINGIEIVNYAFRYQIGDVGRYALSACILLFGYSTILSGYFYLESMLTFLNKTKYIKAINYIITVNLFISSIIPPSFIWNLVDIITGLLAIINIYSIYKLKDKIKR